MLMTQEKTVDMERFFYLMVGATLAFLLVLCFPYMLEASGAIGSGSSEMPWEAAINTIANSLTGPVAKALSLIMVVVGVGVLMFGGDLAGWARWVAFAAIAAGTLGGAANLISALGVSGALI